jgi:hypothetical protein
VIPNVLVDTPWNSTECCISYLCALKRTDHLYEKTLIYSPNEPIRQTIGDQTDRPTFEHRLTPIFPQPFLSGVLTFEQGNFSKARPFQEPDISVFGGGSTVCTAGNSLIFLAILAILAILSTNDKYSSGLRKGSMTVRIKGKVAIISKRKPFIVWYTCECPVPKAAWRVY